MTRLPDIDWERDGAGCGKIAATLALTLGTLGVLTHHFIAKYVRRR